MKKSLETKIRIEVVGANLVIEDLDININIKKTNESTPNTCTCEIWNLSDNTNEILKDKSKGARVYVSKGGGDYVLIFEGTMRSLKKRSKAKKPKKPRKTKTAKVQHYNKPSFQQEVEGADVKTILELEDGHKAINLNPYFSKSYDGYVTNTTIINDCLDNLRRNNIPIGAVDTFNEKAYPNGKTYHGTTMSVLNSVCRAVKCIPSVQNGVFSIVNTQTKGSNYAIVLNGYNCAKPESGTDKETEITSMLLPSLNPNDLVYLDFKNKIEGVFRTYQVEHDFDNYGKKEETKITVKEK